MFRLLREKHRANGPAELARALGLDRGWLNKLETGTGMKADSLIMLLEAAGLSLERLLEVVREEGDVEDVVREEVAGTYDGLPIVARVAAGTGRCDFDHDDEPRAVIESFVEYASDGDWWGYGTGRAVGVQIDGDSMEPEYPHGSIIMVRRVADASKLPDGAPVIFREIDSGESTFKLLRRSRVKRKPMLIGQPINPDSTILAWAPDEVDVTHIYVGTVKR